MNNKVQNIMLFFFGVLFAIIGYFVVDKLDSIKNTMTEIKNDLKEVQAINAEQDLQLLKHETLINEGIMNR